MRGITLVELVVTLAIAAIIAAIAAPNMTEFVRRGRVVTGANELISALQTARMNAISNRATVTVCPSADGATCAGAMGTRWIVRSTKNGASTVVRQVTIANNLLLTASPNLAGAANTFTFSPNGFSAVGARTSGTLSVCGSDLSGQNAVDVSASVGRISSARRVATAACTAPADN